MPTRKSNSPWTFPFHISFLISHIKLPQCEISRVSFPCVIDSCSCHDSFDMFVSYKHIIVRHLRRIHIDAISFDHIGETFLSKLLYHLNLFCNMISCTRHNIKFFYTKCRTVLMKNFFIFLCDIPRSESLSTSTFLHFIFSMICISLILACQMSNIRDVYDMSRMKFENMFDDIFEKIIHEIFTHITDMRCAINRRSARINTYIVSINW